MYLVVGPGTANQLAIEPETFVTPVAANVHAALVSGIGDPRWIERDLTGIGAHHKLQYWRKKARILSILLRTLESTRAIDTVAWAEIEHQAASHLEPPPLKAA